MLLTINPADDLPIYRQIMRQMLDAIAAGRLKPGEKLSSHRELSEQIVVAPLTVKKAYDELESLGYLETQRGRGTFVRAQLPVMDNARVREAAERLLSQAYLAGMNFAQVLDLLGEADRQLSTGPAEKETK